MERWTGMEAVKNNACKMIDIRNIDRKAGRIMQMNLTVKSQREHKSIEP